MPPFLTVLGVASVPDLNLFFNIIQASVLLIGAGYAGPKVLKAKQQQAELAAKDRIIETREQDSRALHDRLSTMNDDLDGCRINLRKMDAEAAVWKGRYEEQGKYTAENALSTVTTILGSMDEKDSRRHDEVMASLHNIAQLVGDRRSAPPHL